MKKAPEPFKFSEKCNFSCIKYLEPYAEEMRAMFLERYGNPPGQDIIESFHELPSSSPEARKVELYLKIQEAKEKIAKLPLYLHLIRKNGGHLILSEDFASEDYGEILKDLHERGENEKHQIYFYNFRIRGHLEDVLRNYREFKELCFAEECKKQAKTA